EGAARILRGPVHDGPRYDALLDGERRGGRRRRGGWRSRTRRRVLRDGEARSPSECESGYQDFHYETPGEAARCTARRRRSSTAVLTMATSRPPQAVPAD